MKFVSKQLTLFEHYEQHDDILACFELDRLENREKRFRWTWTDNGKKLASLKRDLDKLTFANNAYKERAVKTEGKINIHVRMT